MATEIHNRPLQEGGDRRRPGRSGAPSARPRTVGRARSALDRVWGTDDPRERPACSAI
jgi:hypothetical protein